MWKSFRGASWNDHVCYLRASFRGRYDTDLRNSFIGFRIACDVEPTMALRGGSWATELMFTGNTVRISYWPDIRVGYAGFRVACEVPPPSVLRGGSWCSNPNLLRASNRGWAGPGFRGSLNGFRVACDVSCPHCGNDPASTERVSEMGRELLQKLGINMLLVPAGKFTMGSPDGEGFDDERPQHKRKLKKPFMLAETAVTNDQYLAFCEATGHEKPKFARDPNLHRLNQPVVGVNYYDAVAFCEWLTKETGVRFFLPSEEQWERAARGDDGRKYPWGNEAPTEEHACFWKSGRSGPGDVGSHPKGDGPYGNKDLAGNVWEWTSTEYAADAYKRFVEARAARKAAKAARQS